MFFRAIHEAENENHRNENWLPWKPNEEDGRMVLKEIMRSGNFGNMDETMADLTNKWNSLWFVSAKTIRFWRFDHWAWFWSPLWRIYHYSWRKLKGFK